MNLLGHNGQIEGLLCVQGYMMKNWTKLPSSQRPRLETRNCYDPRSVCRMCISVSRVSLFHFPYSLPIIGLLLHYRRTLPNECFFNGLHADTHRASCRYDARFTETLIVWTEPDGTDWALSFQDVEGCTEIWDFIIEVQRHFRGKSTCSLM